jgi:hypothetical protein
MPLAPPPTQPADQVLKTIRILVLAMMVGVAVFAVVSVLLGPVGNPPAGGAKPNTDPAVFLLITGGLSVVALAGNVVVGGWAGRQAETAWRDAGEARGRDAVAKVLMTTSVVRAALAESAGLMGCITVLLTGNLLGLAGVAFAGVLMGALLPVEARMAGLYRRAAGERFGM